MQCRCGNRKVSSCQPQLFTSRHHWLMKPVHIQCCCQALRIKFYFSVVFTKSSSATLLWEGRKSYQQPQTKRACSVTSKEKSVCPSVSLRISNNTSGSYVAMPGFHPDLPVKNDKRKFPMVRLLCDSEMSNARSGSGKERFIKEEGRDVYLLPAAYLCGKTDEHPVRQVMLYRREKYHVHEARLYRQPSEAACCQSSSLGSRVQLKTLPSEHMVCCLWSPCLSVFVKCLCIWGGKVKSDAVWDSYKRTHMTLYPPDGAFCS